MKRSFLFFSILVCVTALSACSSLQKTYWRRIDSESAMYLTGPRAVERLDQDVALCTRAVESLVEFDALRETMPPDTPPGVESGYDAPARLGEGKKPHSDFHDFEGCMRFVGWERQGIVRYQTVMKADNEYADTQSIRQTGMTRAEKYAADMRARQARQEALVKPGGQFSFGVQGYQDGYKEPSLGVETTTQYLGVTAGYLSRNGSHDFWGVSGRIARGEADYTSSSGILNGIPEWDGYVQWAMGADYPLGEGWISPYWGFGARIYRMNGKGLVTNLGAFAYDRRIEQLYLPVGATWRTLVMGWWPLSSTLEISPLLIGRVNSRLTNAGGPNFVNTQSILSGYGLRGEMMIGSIPTAGPRIEFGPFFNYWHVNDSTTKVIPGCCAGLEPDNMRMQVGVAARVLF